MEKFQIAKYGMMQVTAIVYGVLLSGAGVKWCGETLPEGLPMPGGYYHAIFFRDYGFFLFAIVIVWALWVSYLSSSVSPWELDSDNLALSGLGLAILLAVVSTYFAVSGITPLLPITTGMSLP